MSCWRTRSCPPTRCATPSSSRSTGSASCPTPRSSAPGCTHSPVPSACASASATTPPGRGLAPPAGTWLARLALDCYSMLEPEQQGTARPRVPAPAGGLRPRAQVSSPTTRRRSSPASAWRSATSRPRCSWCWRSPATRAARRLGLRAAVRRDRRQGRADRLTASRHVEKCSICVRRGAHPPPAAPVRGTAALVHAPRRPLPGARGAARPRGRRVFRADSRARRTCFDDGQPAGAGRCGGTLEHAQVDPARRRRPRRRVRRGDWSW